MHTEIIHTAPSSETETTSIPPQNPEKTNKKRRYSEAFSNMDGQPEADTSKSLVDPKKITIDNKPNKNHKEQLDTKRRILGGLLERIETENVENQEAIEGIKNALGPKSHKDFCCKMLEQIVGKNVDGEYLVREAIMFVDEKNNSRKAKASKGYHRREEENERIHGLEAGPSNPPKLNKRNNSNSITAWGSKINYVEDLNDNSYITMNDIKKKVIGVRIWGILVDNKKLIISDGKVELETSDGKVELIISDGKVEPATKQVLLDFLRDRLKEARGRKRQKQKGKDDI